MDSQVQAALGISEILILILIQLDVRTLLLSQRVCRQWAEIIRSTAALQRALFFRPKDKDTRLGFYNPLLKSSFSTFFSLIWDNSIQVIDLADLALEHPENRDRYLRPEASWRQMLTQQPPIYTTGQYTSRVGGLAERFTDLLEVERVQGGGSEWGRYLNG